MVVDRERKPSPCRLMKLFSLPARLALGLVFFATVARAVPGLEVGTRAPAFALPSAQGQETSLETLLQKGPVALVFYRSADWCPYCIRQLKDLQARRADLAAAGVQLVGISYDSPETLAKAVAKNGLDLTLLADVGSKTIDAYGIRNQALKGRAAGVPHPTIFIVDREGVIRARLQRDGFKERPEADEIIAAAKSLR
jgi:peroxiredoxin